MLRYLSKGTDFIFVTLGSETEDLLQQQNTKIDALRKQAAHFHISYY